VAPGSTLNHVVFFSSDGVAYTLPIEQIPVSSGYGEPLSKHARMGDGAHLVAAITTDSRFTPEDKSTRKKPLPTPHVLIVTEKGQIMRISFSLFRTASTKAGRKYCRLAKEDRVVYAGLVEEAETMLLRQKMPACYIVKLKKRPCFPMLVKGSKVSDLKRETMSWAPCN